MDQLDSLYSDPAQIKRIKEDYEMMQFVAPSLAEASIGPTVLSNGMGPRQCLRFRGTIPITFKNAGYNIPIEVALTDTYPIEQPTVRVVPTPGMVIQGGHRNVDGETGVVFHPYLTSWNAFSSNLAELLTVLNQAFSQAPPLYSVSPSSSPPPSYSSTPPAALGSSAAPRPFASPPPPPYQQQQQQQPPPAQPSKSLTSTSSSSSAARPPPYGGPPPPAIRLGNNNNNDAGNGGGAANSVSRDATAEHEDADRVRARLVKILTNKLRAKLSNVFLPQIQKELAQAFETQERLDRNEEEIRRSMEKVKAYEADLARQAEEMEQRARRVRELMRRLDEVRDRRKGQTPDFPHETHNVNAKSGDNGEHRLASGGVSASVNPFDDHPLETLGETLFHGNQPGHREEEEEEEEETATMQNNGTNGHDDDIWGNGSNVDAFGETFEAPVREEADDEVDEIAMPKEALDAQLFECVAEMNAAEDALFFLDRCLAKGAIDLKTYLRQTRNTSREQFFKVALANRIVEVLAKQRGGASSSSSSSAPVSNGDHTPPLAGYPELG